MKKYLDKKYTPFYMLFAGILVFAGAFFYAAKRDVKPEKTAEEVKESELSRAGGEEQVLDINTEIKEINVPSVTPTPTLKPKSTSTPSPVPTATPTLEPTNSPTPTEIPSNTSTPSPTNAPTTTPTEGEPTLTPTDSPEVTD